jgi:hypothetical protein
MTVMRVTAFPLPVAPILMPALLPFGTLLRDLALGIIVYVQR